MFCLKRKMTCEKTPLLIQNAVVNIPETAPAFTALSAKELSAYIEDPFWVRLRKICFAIYVLTLCTFLAGGLALATTALCCRSPQYWWQEGVAMYRVLAPSFFDSDGSGLGDIKGIQLKLDYINTLGVKAICLSPIYTSPMLDFGYDIQDFKDIDKKFGTIDDFKNLLQEMKQRGIKMVMDFVPNHSSDQHEWFQKSIKGEYPYTDYYVWASAKAIVDNKPVPPNNWVSIFGGSAWEWNEVRGSFYLHQFAKQQPDLNFRNPAVVREILEAIEFWLEMGVDGFRMESVAYLFEDRKFRDEPQSKNSNSSSNYSQLDHIYTYNLPEVRDVVAQFRHLLDKYSNTTDQIKRLLMTEVYDSVENTMQFYVDENHPLADFPSNFLLITQLNNQSTAKDVVTTINMWLDNVPPKRWTIWELGNHDSSRAATRFGSDLIDGLNMLALLLPGTAITYAGEEIGMEDTPISWKENTDPAALKVGPEYYRLFTRDPQRTPMQWNSKKNAGFSDANATWLPVNANYKTVNVEVQSYGQSHLNVYKALVRARRSPAIIHGDLKIRVFNNNSIIAFTREYPGTAGFATVVNWSNSSQIVDLTAFKSLPATADVFVRSVSNSPESSRMIFTKSVFVGPKEGVVLTFAPN